MAAALNIVLIAIAQEPPKSSAAALPPLMTDELSASLPAILMPGWSERYCT
jgi:hypothetical protein